MAGINERYKLIAELKHDLMKLTLSDKYCALSCLDVLQACTALQGDEIRYQRKRFGYRKIKTNPPSKEN